MAQMRVKVSIIAFSKTPYLVETLQKEFPDSIVNTEGIRFEGDALVNYLSGADGAIVGLEQITADVLDRLPSLRFISKFGVGLDNIDLAACAVRNIQVGWTGGVNKRAVAEMALGFMLMLSRNLYSSSNQLKQLIWNKNGGTSLGNKTIGIIGLGHTGKELVQLLAPFQCTILANDIADVKEFSDKHTIKMVSKEELYASADIISVHTPLTDLTRNLFDKEVFGQMKPTAFLINTARGGIVNENDLKIALQQNLIAGASLDVYETEPPVDQELLSLPNLICTPHIGGNSYEAVVAMGLSAISHLVKFRDNQTIQ
jgi:phosphoglycerate dehydrogenase-like enzyme